MAERSSLGNKSQRDLVTVPKRPGNVNTGVSSSTRSSTRSSSKCCTLTEDTASAILSAIQTGNGQRLKESLSPYHTGCMCEKYAGYQKVVYNCMGLFNSTNWDSTNSDKSMELISIVQMKRVSQILFCFLMDVIPLNHVSH